MSKTVFVSGSRVCKLDNAASEKIRNWMSQGYSFIVGDCKGVDTDVQKFLADNGYQSVTVCYSAIPNSAASMARNIDTRAKNLGWKIQPVVVHNAAPYTRHFYTAKDVYMTDEADILLVVWDGKSAGSKNNIDRAIAKNKNIAVRVNNAWK